MADHTVTTWTLLLLLLLIYPCHGFFYKSGRRQEPEAKITALSTFVWEGGTQVANCTLTDSYDGPYNASHIYFKLGNEKVSSDNVVVLNERTTQVTLRNMSRFGKTQLYCFINKSMLQMFVTHVGVSPVKPVMTQEDCIVYNWERMECAWGPIDQNWRNITNLVTNTTLFWSIQNREKTVCPHQPLRNEFTQIHRSSVCMWNKTEFLPDEVYCMKIYASNPLGSSESDDVIVNSSKIVKPHAVRNLMVVSFTSHEVELSWGSPTIPGRKIHYRITYRSQRDTNNVDVYREGHNLTSLTPYTNYTIDVMAKPQVGGIWSESKQSTVKTKSTVPGRVPAVTAGGFQVDSCGDQCKNIIIYWQKIPEIEWHGPNFHYKVNVVKSDQCLDVEDLSFCLPSSASNTSINTSSNICNLSVSISSTNDEGEMKPTNDDTILINILQNNNQDQQHPSHVTANAINDSTVRVVWDSNVNQDVQVTVFWCTGSTHELKCIEELNWKKITHKSQEAIVLLPNHYREYLFGVAYIVAGKSTGIQWANCVLDNRIMAHHPEGSKAIVHSSPGSLYVSWIPHDCSQRGYITNYVIYYCPVDSNGRCTEPESHVNVSRDQSEYVLEGLDPGQEYRVQVKSQSHLGVSPKVAGQIYITASTSWFHGPRAAGTVIGAIIIGILFIFGIVGFALFAHKKCSWFSSLPIKMPKEVPTHSLSTSSDYPIVQRDHSSYSNGGLNSVTVPFTSQLSEESCTDSGHGSLSDQMLLRTRQTPSITEDDVFTQEDNTDYRRVTYLQPAMDSTGYLKPIPSSAVEDNGYLSPVSAASKQTQIRTSLPSVEEEPEPVQNVVGNPSYLPPGVCSVNNPGYQSVDILMKKCKDTSSVV